MDGWTKFLTCVLHDIRPFGSAAPPKKEKQMGDARAKREGSETTQGLAQRLKSLALASEGLALASQGQAPISEGLALASQVLPRAF